MSDSSREISKEPYREDAEPTQRRTSRYGDDWNLKADPFGDESNAQVKYRTLTWWQTSLLMIAETVSLGILSLPSVMAAIGMVPGVILLVTLGAAASYTGYVYGQFKAAYPHVANMADAGEVLMGAFGREFVGTAQIFILGSHLLTFTIAFNAITGHATCTIVWGVVGLCAFFILSLPRTLKKVSYMSIASFISIVGAVFITLIAVAIEKPGRRVDATVTTDFASAFSSAMNICFAYAGHMAFFSFISEMKKPEDFPKALAGLQISDISLYIITAVVIYTYAGPDVASPALGSTTPVVKKVAYGIALPTIVIAGVIYANVAAKQIYVRLFRGTRHIHESTWLSVGTWIGIVLTLWIIGWIIAESIPVFNDLNSLIVALFVSWFTYGLPGVFWLFINYGQSFKNWKKASLTIINMFLVVLGAAICGIGLYATGTAINADAGSGASWSCADNS
ncbi:hypothetical protein M409DRAFT_64669 [Zasmidium cellare ATCC 36951]|uniref:Amino acid transporter transmembrane domain-containing protein n=1 Tax=Zasmidium cellare ATCC 36951 TaxID=1080233 RepID=A0A6A6CUS7_ZASCE|nr:uncharacterized protein M409DRAFT_64669 [Zasmidium cellare ATCC 36951]KAF2169582.1 hypothetical protein M409DRAFT_64669 [Zasmidium cellare ATCC 36951]